MYSNQQPHLSAAHITAGKVIISDELGNHVFGLHQNLSFLNKPNILNFSFHPSLFRKHNRFKNKKY